MLNIVVDRKREWGLTDWIEMLIWLDRNGSKFEKHMKNSLRTLSEAHSKWVSWKLEEEKEWNLGEREQINKKKESQWIPPDRGYMKVNFDASFNRYTKAATGAAICRDDEGRIIGGAYKKFNANSAEIAESKAVEVAVILAKELKLGAVIFEGDNDNVIKALSSRDTLAWETENLFHFIFSSLSDFQDFRFESCNRLANEAAHNLAKWAVTESEPLPSVFLDALRPIFHI
ncbi:hypothetical protein ACHQM5_029062 [Ranunculus cassubicifolius]